MKILHCVENYLPARSGMQEVVTQLSERLVQKGFDVTIVTAVNDERKDSIINGVKIVSFDIQGNYVVGYKGNTTAYQQFLLQSDFDVIVSFAAQQWTTDLLLPIIKEVKAYKVFVPTGFSALNNPAYAEYYQQMNTWMKEYDMNVFLSSDYRDINFAKAAGIEKWKIIPNGASKEEFNHKVYDIRPDLELKQDDFVILLVGSFTGLKGHFEALRIFKNAKLEKAVLLLIGNDLHNAHSLKSKVFNLLKFILAWFGNRRPVGQFYYKLIASFYNRSLSAKRNSKRIIIKELKRKEIVACYQTADVFLFPSMIECSPIVLFESMASETPFLTSDVGNTREIITWSDGGVLLPTTFDGQGYSITDINGAAKVLTDMYKDESKRKSLAQSGYTAFVSKFDWNRIADEYANTYFSLKNETV